MAETRLPDPGKSLEEQDDITLFAMCLWGETRGVDPVMLAGVAWTVVHRVQRGGWYGKGLRGVLLKPKQFSCFNAGDPNREKMFRPLEHGTIEHWAACYQAAVQYAPLCRDTLEGPFPGVVAYYDASMDAHPPTWSNRMELVKRVGRMRFFRERKK